MEDWEINILKEKAEEMRKNVELATRHGRIPQEQVERVKAQAEKAQAAYEAAIA